jgi:DNA-directed RNA polymerase specialized sigma24 family protein
MTTRQYECYRLASDQKPAIIERARQGDQDAREQIVLALMDTIQGYAHRHATAMRWSGRIETEDLLQLGMLAILEHLDIALTKDNPLGYLTTVARCAIIRHCVYHSSLITRPRAKDSIALSHMPDMVVMSLEKPLDQDGLTLGDVLPGDSAPAPERDYTPLYEAVKALPEKHQAVIVRYYGLLQHAPERLCTIGRDIGTKKPHRYAQVAYKRLARSLEVAAL